MRHRDRHISLDQIVDVARGHLPATEQQSIHAHTASCVACAAQMARIERLIAVTSADDSEEPPAHVVARAARLMRQRNAAGLPVPRRRVMASMHFDSRRSPIALGARSQSARTRQLMFETEQHNVDLRIKPAGAQWSIWGQVLGSVAGGQVMLQGPATVHSELNSLSEFSLPPVPPGDYSLLLRLDDLEIEMALNIGE